MPSKLVSPGLPLCLSGFSLSHRPLTTEMEDHDRRREAMRRRRSSSADTGGIGFTRYIIQAIGDGDLHDLCEKTKLTSAAKAA
ncbi:hypothetical protein SDJN02_02260 [Cucurbita argyrosperma subsp. argyrosperma]